MPRNAGRRAGDSGWLTHTRENWYRDVWLLAITLVVLASLWSIQQSRVGITRDNCNAQNRRHAIALAELNRQLAPLAVSHPVQAMKTLAQAGVLISDLAPHQNCDRVVSRITAWWSPG